jgi:hypothetical protein
MRELDTHNTADSIKINDKAILLQAWTCPEGSSRLRLPEFKAIGT